MFVDPIDTKMQCRVVAEVERCLGIAAQSFGQTFAMIPVTFDLKGRAAGMYRVRGSERVIRFNPWLFAKYPEDSWHNTVPHEVAHYVADCIYGLGRIKPHGPQWQHIMQLLGAEPTVRANYDLSGIPVRQIKRYHYRCQCREVQLTTYRHKKIQQGQQRYRCRDCGSDLQFVLP